MKVSKRFKEASALVERNKIYDSVEAMALAVKTASAKFDESVELHVKLGVDSKHADQQVRGVVVLPNGTGKTVKVLVIAKGDKADEALAAGADIVGAEEIIAKITKAQIREIAELKMPDLNAASIEAAMSMIAGTARSMGVVVED